MFVLGFFTDLKEVNSLVQLLMKYLGASRGKKDNLKYTQNFTRSLSLYSMTMTDKNQLAEDDTELEEIEVQNQKLIDCKKKVCKILQFTLTVKNELRINHFLQQFKKLVNDLNAENQKHFMMLKSNNEADIKERKDYELKIMNKMDNMVGELMSQETTIKIDRTENFISKLLELLLHKNQSLKTAAMCLMDKLHSQNKNLHETIFNIQIIDDNTLIRNYRTAKSMANVLNNIGDTIEKWYKNPESKEMKDLVEILKSIYQNLLHQGVPPVLPRASGEIGNNPEPCPEPTSGFTDNKSFQGRRPRVTKTYLHLQSNENLSDIYQYLIDSKDEQIDTFEQELVRNSGIYTGILKMLEFDAEVVDMNRATENKIMIRKMYRILAKSIKDSDKNKTNLTKYLESIILTHYKDRSADLNSYFLLKQIVIDNKSILLNQGLVNKISDAVCETLETWNSSEIKKSFSLSILSDMMRYKNYILKKNQNLILSKIVGPDYNNINLNFDASRFEEDLIKSGKTKNLKTDVQIINGSRVLVLPAKICYVAAYMNLLTTCTEEKNAFSENICQNLLNLDTLNKFIKHKDLNIVLKHSILLFFYHVYLDTERDIPFHIMEIFLNILKFICEDFDFYARKKYLDDEESIESYEDFYILSYDSFKTFNCWIESYLIVLIESFTNIIRRNLNLIPESKPARFYQEFLINLINVAQQTYLKYKNKDIHEKLNILLREIFINHQKEEIADKITSKHRDKINPNTLTTDLHGISRKKSKRRGTRLRSTRAANSSLFQVVEYLIDLYFQSDTFKYRCQKEFNGIVGFLNKIELKRETGRGKINFDRFCTSLMKYLHPHNEEGVGPLRTMGLRILRSYIEKNSGVDDHRSLINWELDNWKDTIPILKSRQDKLVELKVVRLVCMVFIEAEDLEIIKETLLLSIALLFGGNPNSQKAFLTFFQNNLDNVFLHKLRDVMFSAFEIIKKNIREKNARTMKQFYSKFDNVQEGVKEKEEERDMSKIRAEVENVADNYEICRYIFKFIQLLCEGHNEDLQNLLREQQDSSESNYKSINFISSTAALWGSFIKFVNPDSLELGEMMIEFLVEAIQGPCVKNQLELFNNKIIDFSKDFMNDFSNPRDYESRGFSEENSSQLDDLISQNIKMLYSLMEANQDDEMYRNMGNNISFKSLISKLLAKFKELFRKDIDIKDSKNMLASKNKLEARVRQMRQFSEEAEEAFDIFFFIQTINDHTQLYAEDIKALSGSNLLAFQFFEENSAHIEIVFRGDIHKIYFIVQPSCRYLDVNEQKYVRDEEKQKTPNEKITDFTTKAPGLFDIMDHMNNLQTSCPMVTQNTFNNTRYACLAIVSLINLYVFVLYKKDVNFSRATTSSPEYTSIFLKVFGAAHIFCSVLMLLLWLILNGTLLIMQGWRAKFQKLRKNLPKLLENYNGMDTHTIRLNFNKTLQDLTKTERIRMLQFINEGLGFHYSIPTLEYYFTSLRYILSNWTFYYFMMYICLSVITFIKGEVILYSVHLLDVIVSFSFLTLEYE